MFGFGCFDRLAYKKTAASERIPPGKGTATALCPRRAVECVSGVCVCLTAPPDCSLSRQSETAGRVKKGLGLAVLTDSPTKNRRA